MKKNVFFLSAFILTLVGALFLSARIISADEDTPSFITKTIAQKFHLKESKVKEIIYFYHREKRKAHLSHMLDILIEKGKITSEQKEDLLNKLS